MNVIQEIYRENRNSFKLDLALNGIYIIELFSFPSPPKRMSFPEATGLRHIAFEVENLDLVIAHIKSYNIEIETIRVDEFTGKKYTFIFDPDDLPIELYES